MQYMDILTGAISDETSVYKTPPEVQKSEVVSKTRASFSVFACSSTKALWSEVSRRENIFQPHEKCQTF